MAQGPASAGRRVVQTGSPAVAGRTAANPGPGEEAHTDPAGRPGGVAPSRTPSGSTREALSALALPRARLPIMHVQRPVQGLTVHTTGEEWTTPELHGSGCSTDGFPGKQISSLTPYARNGSNQNQVGSHKITNS